MGQAIPFTAHRKNTVPPVATAKLMDAIGPGKTSEQLGVSTTLLHKARQEGEITRVVEIAAAGVLEHLPSSTVISHVKAVKPTKTPPIAVRGGEAMFLIAVDRTKAPIVEQMAKALGAELVSA